jgi:probable rRNA maturation factor
MPEDCDSSRNDGQASASADGAAGVEPRQWLTLDVVDDAGDWTLFEPVEAHVRAAAAALAANPAFAAHSTSEAVVALSDDENVRALNASYRGLDKPTNVLSFPSGAAPRGGVIALGDIVLAAATVAREAHEQGVPPAHHLQHLVVHGLLHLLGFDHETEAEAAEMEALEIDVLSALNIANPYTEPAETPAEHQKS